MNATLGEIAYARSGDKGASANIGVIARSPAAYQFLLKALTAEAVGEFFGELRPGKVRRYEMPNLLAINFVIEDILDGGGSLSLRVDAQGKGLGQALLRMPVNIPGEVRGATHG